MMIINIAEDYTKTPGGRYIKEGEFSGQAFRNDVLLPAFKKAKMDKESLQVNLDGGYGYGSSFLEEAFGGLARETKDRDVLKIEIISEEEPRLVDDIRRYMEDALNG